MKREPASLRVGHDLSVETLVGVTECFTLYRLKGTIGTSTMLEPERDDECLISASRFFSFQEADRTMPEPMTSDPWVEKLKDPVQQEEALIELRVRLVRGLKRAFSSAGESFAEDIAQDALIRILEKIDQFEGRSQFSTWAMSIAVRLATSQVRRKHFKDVSLEQFSNGEGPTLDVAVDTVPGAAEQLEQSSIYQTLSELIDGLSDRQQTAVRAVLSGMPVEEIADRTGSNRNAVYKLVHDARTRLKRGLEAAGYSADDLTGSIA